MDTYFTSTIFRKTLAALSGLFLVLFLVGHLVGNLQLIFASGDSGQKQFNEYALFMTTNPAVKVFQLLHIHLLFFTHFLQFIWRFNPKGHGLLNMKSHLDLKIVAGPQEICRCLEFWF